MAEKGIFIKEIKDGLAVEGLFLVKEMSRHETRNGSPYLHLVLLDASGEMTARVWDRADEYVQECLPGTLVRVRGLAQSYKETLQLRILALGALSSQEATAMGLAEFLPATRGNVEQMEGELRALAGSVTDRWLKGLLDRLFADAAFMVELREAPAAKAMHHACVGGLLEHTLAVTRLADMVSSLYPAVDRSLLIAGAILHDLGKVREFSLLPQPFQYTDEGRLVGHMVIGVEMVTRWVQEVPEFPADLAVRVKHLILSHHGRHEFGAPTLPMVLESFILNFVDDLDAKVNCFERLAASARAGGYAWSDYQRTLERFLFVRGHEPEVVAGPMEPFFDEPPLAGHQPKPSSPDAAAPGNWQAGEPGDNGQSVRKKEKKTITSLDSKQERLF